VRVSRPVPQPNLRPLWIVTQAGALEIGEKYSSRWRGTIFEIAPPLAKIMALAGGPLMLA
jgi:hypothetical protein